jgi:signal transduction histidine kinase/CheY-like chemotaxis protein
LGTLVDQPAIRFVNRYRCKDGGYRHTSWTGIQEDNFVYCTGRDITAEREAELQLEAAQDALRQSQKMDAIGQLTGGIAHDFNNLLTGIIGSLDLARRRTAANKYAEAARFMDAATGSAHRAAALTHRLLAFARRQSLDTRPNEVNRLVAGMEDLIQRTLGEHIELVCKLSDDIWTASTDANQLENALLNLASNARDAMAAGGRLTIETANVLLDEEYTSSHEDVQPGDFVSVSVSDTGSGMSPEVLAKAMDPFFTTKAIGEGTGLGLSVIYGFAKQSHGHLRLFSEPGRGTTVTIYLPRAHHTALESTVRQIASDALKDLGYQVLEAPDARAGIPLLQSELRIDLLISDVMLPHINGRKLAETARASRPDLKVLFVTGYAENATTRSEFLDAGMDMLLKPFALDVLGAKVRAMIEWNR